MIRYKNGAESDNENDDKNENENDNESEIKYFNNDVLLGKETATSDTSDMIPKNTKIERMFFEKVLSPNKVRLLSAHVQRVRSHKNSSSPWTKSNYESNNKNENENEKCVSKDGHQKNQSVKKNLIRVRSTAFSSSPTEIGRASCRERVSSPV